MKTRNVLAIACVWMVLADGAAQVTLQPWVQVYGTVYGQRLGAEVRGIPATANLPYKASISSFGNTGLYTLQTQNDTAAQSVFFGGNMQTGDLNGDGWKDIVLRRIGTAPSYIDTVVVYWGTASGVDTATATRLTGSNLRENFGMSICIADLVGDSVSDLIIGAPRFGQFQGRVYVYQGGSPFGQGSFPILNGDSAYMNLGVASAIGDLNNDGFNDLAVRGWYTQGFDSVRYDYVNVWFCGAVCDTLHDMHLRSKYITSQGLASFDANGDGIADLLWTNRDSMDWIYVHYGGTAFSSLPNLRLRDPQFAVFGNVVANAGDMNGDAFDDVVVGSYANITTGFVFVYGGGPQIDQYFDAAVGMSSDSYFGRSVSGVGDVSGDGLADIIVGAPNYAFGDNRGYWGIFKGDSSIQVTDVKEGPGLPSAIKLYQSYPNPFNPSTIITYELSRSAHVVLQVFTLLGQRVGTLREGNQLPGRYDSVFDGSGLSTGIYLYRLTATTTDGKTYTDAKKLTLIK